MLKTNENSEVLDALLERGDKNPKINRFCCKCCLITMVSVFGIVFILFLIAFVIFPVIFMNDINIQREFVFTAGDNTPNEEYSNFAKYGIKGVRNLYVTVNKESNISLGVWHLLPESLIQESTNNSDYDYDDALAKKSHDVVFYFHGNRGNRITRLPTYSVLRKFFHVIAFDYRSFGDSTKADLTEEGLVSDAIQLYKWIRERTKVLIYVWGYSLGTSIASHMIARLKNENIIPTGLFLEAPFTSARETIVSHPFSKKFSWLPWFEATMLDPLEINGFRFETVKYISNIDCPILMLHAEDDKVVSYHLSRKLLAATTRNSNQGNITYIGYPAELGYDHWLIYQDPNLPNIFYCSSIVILKFVYKMSCCKCTRGTKQQYIIREMRSSRRCLIKVISPIMIIIIILAVLFIATFVLFPLIFQNSIAVQRFLIFVNVDNPVRPEYRNSKKYGIQGVRNLYLNVNHYKNVSLGIWHILPEALVNDSQTEENYSYDKALKNSTYDVLLYFHGTGVNRIAFVHMYKILRKFFHVIAFDYRGYGDSTPAVLSEEAIVLEATQVYKWLQYTTTAKIYVWGYSLGSALGTRTVAKLRDENIVPKGLILEAPFTSIREEIPLHPIGRLFAWLPWFKKTILDPVETNQFHFKTDQHILKVNCPIMIMHAEDDSIVPYELGKKLSEIAEIHRNTTVQGSVTYHQFPAHLYYDHTRIANNPELEFLIEKFIAVCDKFDKQRIIN